MNIPPSFNLSGNKQKAVELRSQAQQLYNFISNQADQGGINFFTKSITLQDGSIISVVTKKEGSFNLRTGTISIYGTPSSISVTNKYIDILLMLDSRNINEPTLKIVRSGDTIKLVPVDTKVGWYYSWTNGVNLACSIKAWDSNDIVINSKTITLDMSTVPYLPRRMIKAAAAFTSTSGCIVIGSLNATNVMFYVYLFNKELLTLIGFFTGYTSVQDLILTRKVTKSKITIAVNRDDSTLETVSFSKQEDGSYIKSVNILYSKPPILTSTEVTSGSSNTSINSSTEEDPRTYVNQYGVTVHYPDINVDTTISTGYSSKIQEIGISTNPYSNSRLTDTFLFNINKQDITDTNEISLYFNYLSEKRSRIKDISPYTYIFKSRWPVDSNRYFESIEGSAEITDTYNDESTYIFKQANIEIENPIIPIINLAPINKTQSAVFNKYPIIGAWSPEVSMDVGDEIFTSYSEIDITPIFTDSSIVIYLDNTKSSSGFHVNSVSPTTQNVTFIDTSTIKIKVRGVLVDTIVISNSSQTSARTYFTPLSIIYINGVVTYKSQTSINGVSMSTAPPCLGSVYAYNSNMLVVKFNRKTFNYSLTDQLLIFPIDKGEVQPRIIHRIDLPSDEVFTKIGLTSYDKI